ncbi:MAG: response regulator transcription factor [Anaerolineae bacterium]|nr:response regulator transcription factor [Anaerolineae bacterium]
MSGFTVLIVDDEASIVALARLYLERDGYHVLSAGDGQTALRTIQDQKPDLVVLDVMLPELDGFEVCRRLRSENNPVAVVMLTARDEDIDKILGLELGADDYMTKPFNPRELSARVKAVLRRQERQAPPVSEKLVVGNLVVDLASREVRSGGDLLALRVQEFEVLLVFLRNPGRVLTREQLLNLAWGYDFAGQTRTVDMHVAQLRKKLAASRVAIETVTGVGYKLVVNA